MDLRKVAAVPRKMQMIWGNGKLQMIGGDGKFSSDTANFVKDMKSYTVISIIGPQSSGKSTLLNNLFEAKFDVLNTRGKRKQTTKGIWISKCIDPNVIIMDVEGFDGKERGADDILFERQSALFALVVSDVLLLNMWFHDINRQNGANLGLIELIFEERVKIDATKTIILLVVRDYDYETDVPVIMNQLWMDLKEIWDRVVPGKTMSDYFEFSLMDFSLPEFHMLELEQKFCLMDFPPNKYEKEKFAEKENKERTEYGSNFSSSSEETWNSIQNNKEIIPADHKVEKSKIACKESIKRIIDTLHKEKGNWMTDLSIPVNKFCEEFSLIREEKLERYEVETASVISTVQREKKSKLEKKLLRKFENALYPRMDDLTSKRLSSAKLNLRTSLEESDKLDNSAIEKVINPYLKYFDDNTSGAADLQWLTYEKTKLPMIRKKFETNLKKLAQEEANDIQFERSVIVCKQIKKKMIDSFEQQWAHWMINLSIPAKQFTTEFPAVRDVILTRYDQESASCNSTVSKAEKDELDVRILSMFRKAFYDRMHDSASKTLSSAKLSLRPFLENLDVLDSSAIEEAVNTYMDKFEYYTPTAEDLQWYPDQNCTEELPIIRMNLSASLQTLAEEEAYNIQVDRSTCNCKKTVKEMLELFDQEKAHWMVDLSISVKNFAAEFYVVWKDILTRYEALTASLVITTRNQEKAELEKKLLTRFQNGLYARMHDLASKKLFFAKTNIHTALEQFAKLDNSAIEEVINFYLKDFDNNTATIADLQWLTWQDTQLPAIRKKFESDLRKHAQEEANIIQLERSISACKKIKKQMIDSFEQEGGDWLNDLSITAKQFTKKFSIVRKNIIGRYEEGTASFTSAIRNEEKEELEVRLLERFLEALGYRMDHLAEKTITSAESNLNSQLKDIKALNEYTVGGVLNSYLQNFDKDAPTAADLMENLGAVSNLEEIVVAVQECRNKVTEDLTKFAEEKANSIQKKRAKWNGLKTIAKIVIGAAWAVVSWDHSVLSSGIAALTSIGEGINISTSR